MEQSVYEESFELGSGFSSNVEHGDVVTEHTLCYVVISISCVYFLCYVIPCMYMYIILVCCMLFQSVDCIVNKL